ncbi:hypothetical protein EJ06DRAFT_523669 [Trichodelitschia bisporula]|uniref:SET domain-containing protein n=1 Tax=Trichodelitschia bisporula TaxID=703511 RepID=A0A6G1HNV6_9PEZI|nr:hypothetical protein EJ06DRAFT_523669 [Trichodelitschia bisporula]
MALIFIHRINSIDLPQIHTHHIILTHWRWRWDWTQWYNIKPGYVDETVPLSKLSLVPMHNTPDLLGSDGAFDQAPPSSPIPRASFSDSPLNSVLHIKVGPSKIHGRGVFAGNDIAVGQTIYAASKVFQFVAGRPIKKGEEITLSYVNWRYQYEERRKLLIEKFGFECLCPSCANHFASESDWKQSDERRGKFSDLMDFLSENRRKRNVPVSRKIHGWMETVVKLIEVLQEEGIFNEHFSPAKLASS